MRFDGIYMAQTLIALYSPRFENFPCMLLFAGFLCFPMFTAGDDKLGLAHSFPGISGARCIACCSSVEPLGMLEASVSGLKHGGVNCYRPLPGCCEALWPRTEPGTIALWGRNKLEESSEFVGFVAEQSHAEDRCEANWAEAFLGCHFQLAPFEPWQLLQQLLVTMLVRTTSAMTVLTRGNQRKRVSLSWWGKAWEGHQHLAVSSMFGCTKEAAGSCSRRETSNHKTRVRDVCWFGA